MEEWLSVVGTEGRYSISSLGRFRNDVTGTIRKPSLKTRNGRSYQWVDWMTAGERVRRSIAELVLEHFVGARPPERCALHWDDDTQNNTTSNLYWGTRSENMQDKIRNGNNQWLKRTHCHQCGLPLEGENVKVSPRGGRSCWSCHRKAVRRCNERAREKMDPGERRAANRRYAAAYRHRQTA